VSRGDKKTRNRCRKPPGRDRARERDERARIVGQAARGGAASGAEGSAIPNRRWQQAEGGRAREEQERRRPPASRPHTRAAWVADRPAERILVPRKSPPPVVDQLELAPPVHLAVELIAVFFSRVIPAAACNNPAYAPPEAGFDKRVEVAHVLDSRPTTAQRNLHWASMTGERRFGTMTPRPVPPARSSGGARAKSRWNHNLIAASGPVVSASARPEQHAAGCARVEVVAGRAGCSRPAPFASSAPSRKARPTASSARSPSATPNRASGATTLPMSSSAPVAFGEKSALAFPQNMNGRVGSHNARRASETPCVRWIARVTSCCNPQRGYCGGLDLFWYPLNHTYPALCSRPLTSGSCFCPPASLLDSVASLLWFAGDS